MTTTMKAANVITEATGITTIETLYLQLLYRCQFRCAHCFHGDRLAWRDAYTPEQATTLISLMHRDFSTSAVNLLGGEPFLYTRLAELLAIAKNDLGMRTEICTNGYRIADKLVSVAHDLDLLRVSLEGMEPANDAIRHPGSFREAITALKAARSLRVTTGVTMTVTAANISDVVPLGHMLSTLGVAELKLHHLRQVGYAASHPELAVPDPAACQRMRGQIAAARLEITILIDDELTVACPAATDAGGYPSAVKRIESDPRGALTMSCNAVGIDAHAFCFDKATGHIQRRAGASDEITLGIPQVVYGRG